MSDLGTVVSKVTRVTTAWIQSVNDWVFRRHSVVYASGNASTDVAAIQAAINALGVGGKLELIGNILTNAPIDLKPQIEIVQRKGTITHSAQTHLFRYFPTNPLDGFPGRIKLSLTEVNGPGAPGSGDALGVYTWGDGWAAVAIYANCPQVEVDGYIRGFFASHILRNCYLSKISGHAVACRHGPMLFGECHSTSLLDLFSDSHTLTGASVNYGNGGYGTMQSPNFVRGAYQNCAVGIWLEACQAPTGVGTIYFEGNGTRDVQVGYNDGVSGAYTRGASFARFAGSGSSSPNLSAGGRSPESGWTFLNVEIEDSTDVQMHGQGYYTGGPTTTPHVRVNGNCERTLLNVCFLTSNDPYDFDTYPHRVTMLNSRPPTGTANVVLNGYTDDADYLIGWSLEGGAPLGGLRNVSLGGFAGIEMRTTQPELRFFADERTRFKRLADNTDMFVVSEADNRVEVPAALLATSSVVVSPATGTAYVSLVNLPTSAAGLDVGQLWRDAAAGNVVKVVV
jgi:hypothetical protein